MAILVVSNWEYGGLGKKFGFMMPSLRPLKFIAYKFLPVCSMKFIYLCLLFSIWVSTLKSLRWWAPTSGQWLKTCFWLTWSVGTALWALTCGPTGKADDAQVFWFRRLEEIAQELSLPWTLGVEYSRFKFRQKKLTTGFLKFSLPIFYKKERHKLSWIDSWQIQPSPFSMRIHLWEYNQNFILGQAQKPYGKA